MQPASQHAQPDTERSQAEAPIDQAAAACFRLIEGKRKADRGQVLLVTSRTGEWAIPKGRIDPGFTAPEAAANEAWEEAGVSGRIAGDSLGSFEYLKVGGWAGRRAVRCRVHVFPLLVDDVQDQWLEIEFRKRRWVDSGDAAREVAQPGLARVLAGFPAWLDAWVVGAFPSA
jgi:8-oxo-dGTP pyrophosphatase MutT (NUDIX family)